MNRLIIVAVILLAAILAWFQIQNSQHTIAIGTDEELAPFLWNWMDPAGYSEETLSRTAEKLDPLRVFFLAFRLLVDHERTGSPQALVSAERALDFMINDYQPAEHSEAGYRWFYGNDHNDIAAPWWSGMDAMFGPMTLYAAYEATGNERYRDIALKSAHRAISSPLDGGVVWRTDDGCWLSEYSWDGMGPEDEYYVLNGHLWGLQALFLLARASQDAQLMDAYDCGLAGTVSKASAFTFKHGNWLKYQLHPSEVINPTHYVLIEFAQFRAMYSLTGEAAYRSMMEARSQAFRLAYPISLYDGPDGLEVLLSLVGAPHPYWTDTYPVTLSCEVEGKTYVSETVSAYVKYLPYADRFIASVTVPADPDVCSVTVHSAVDVEVYSEKPDSRRIESLVHMPVQITPSMDAIRLDDGGDILISPRFKVAPEREIAANDEARIAINLDAPLSSSDVLAFAIETDEPFKVSVFITDEFGNQAQRYYPQLVAGRRNIVMLNILGFENSSEISGSIKTVTFRMFTNPEDNDAHVSIKDMTIIEDAFQMREYFKEEASSYFPQQ